jgi:hypothetical protein
MTRLTHLWFQHIEKCYTLSSFIVNNDELIEFSPLTSRFLLLTRCDVRQCAYITFSSLLSPAISIVLYVMRIHLLYLEIFRPLKQNTRLLFYTDDYRVRWASHPLQSYSVNHHHQHVIVVHAYALIHTWSIYIYIYIWTKEEMHIDEEKKNE